MTLRSVGVLVLLLGCGQLPRLITGKPDFFSRASTEKKLSEFIQSARLAFAGILAVFGPARGGRRLVLRRHFA